MSRIATLAAVAALAVAPAAASANINDIGKEAPTPAPAAQQVDLRSPDTVTPFVPAGHDPSPTTAAQPASPDDGFNWGILGLVLAALAAGAVLAVMVRRHTDAGRPLGA